MLSQYAFRPPQILPDLELESVVSLKDDWENRVQPSAPPSADDVLHFKYGDKKPCEVFGLNKGVPTLDLHGLTAEEARELTRNFLRAHSTQGNLATGGKFTPGTLATGRMPSKTIMIVTGRGVHSEGGVPIIKPVVENILRQRNLQYTVTAKGGAFTVQL